MLTVALWNLAWRRESSPAGMAARRILKEIAPDIVCLTETNVGFVSLGHDVASTDDYWLGPQSTRRKVVLSSRMPWRSVDNSGSVGLPRGRFVAAETETSIGTLRCIGVCVPWRMAGVATGERDKRPWEEHHRYLRGLREIIANNTNPKAIILGDFNEPLVRGRRVPLESHRLFAGLVESRVRARRLGGSGGDGDRPLPGLAPV